MPRKFLEKIFQDLLRKGLIKSKRGSCGGYALAHPPESITFYQVIEAIEGPIAVNVCMDQHPNCDQLPRCTMIGVWGEVQQKYLRRDNHCGLAAVHRREVIAASLTNAA